ncbi:carbohydrate binding domain-containing protein [Candidatus Woesearchaeota archaeon]|nr:carbohydrate binding domain-containing protein [Candidatus Woesearchaeota archaeon]
MKKKVYLECLTKKGISSLIATVLLIGFTITIAALVFKWGSVFTKDISEETSYKLASGLECTKTINLVTENSCIIGNKLRIIITNKADRNLKGAIVRIINSNGLVNQTDINQVIGPFQTVNLDGFYNGLPKDLINAEVTIIPKIDVSGNTEICPAKIFKFTDGMCQNIINYGSFEGVNVLKNQINPDPENFNVWYDFQISSGSIIDNTEVLGTKILKINDSVQPVSQIYQPINVTSSTEYTISGWIKTLSSDSGKIMVFYPTACGGSVSTNSVSTNNQWQHTNATFTAPCTGIAAVILESTVNNPGGYNLFDAIQLYES